MNLIINTDGASRGNPGPASYGFVVKKDGGEILHQEGKKIGIATNNIAEYRAILGALEYVKEHYSHKAPHQILVVCDSQLAKEQLAGNYKIKNPHLKAWFDQIKIIEMDLGVVNYKNVPRAENFIADRLANLALDNS